MDPASPSHPRPVWGFVRSVAWLGRAYHFRAGLILGCLLGEMMFQCSVPIAFKLLVDRVLIGRELRLLPVILGAMGLAAVVVSLIGLGRDRMVARWVAEVLGDLRERMFAHLQRLPLRYFEGTSGGETLNRFVGDTSTVETALTAAVPWALLPGLEVLANVGLLFILEWRLALVALLVFPLSLFGPRWLAPRATRASYERKLEESRAVAEVQENIGAQSVVKAFGLEGRAEARFRACSQRLVASGIRVGFLGALVERSATVGIYVLQVAVLGLGAWLAVEGRITIGNLAAFQTLFLSLSYSLSYVTQYVPHLLQGSGAMQHIEELLAEPTGPGDRSDALPLSRFAKEIVFRRVSFSHGGERPDIIDVSLRIPAGARVAFVGPSGAGKSTLVSLLLRFREPGEGEIELDGRPVGSGTLRSLRDQCAVVFQDNVLFNTSVRENVRLGNLGASDEEVVAAAKAAEVHDAILGLPNGYDTSVGDRGGRLSGGQRQRIALARALLRNPAILVLDEATSALDPGTESLVNRTLARVSEGRTVVSVTHRLASAMDYDRIFVMERGQLVEEGPHQALLAQNGLYARLWRKQYGFTMSDDGGLAGLSASKLAELPLLQQLSAEQREAAARLFQTERLPEGRIVFAEGDPGVRFYVVVRGEVGVYRSESGGEKRLAVLEDGDCFGEMALLRQVPRNATIRTLTPTVILSLHREAFLELLERTPALRQELEALAATRLAGQTLVTIAV